MKPTVFFLADYAIAHSDGKFYVTGGFLRKVALPFLPAEYAHLSLGVRIEFEQQEMSGQYLIEIQSQGPGTSGFVKPYSLRYRPGSVSNDDPPVLQFVYQMEEVPFARPGRHTLSLRVDEVEVASLGFDVEVTTGAGPTADELALMLQLGVTAFSRGEKDEAEAIFKEILKVQPTSAAAINNVAFVHLAQGRPQEALGEFQEAAGLEFDMPELLNANIACCHYLLGEFQRAQELFAQSAAESLVSARSVLFGIDDQELFTVHLESASEYIGLMFLNASWSALKAGAAKESAGYARRAAEFAISNSEAEPTQKARFASSVKSVRQRGAQSR